MALYLGGKRVKLALGGTPCRLNLVSAPSTSQEPKTVKGVWLFNETVEFEGGSWFSVNYTSNGVAYIAMSDRRSETSNVHDMRLRYFTSSSSGTKVYEEEWLNEAYRTVDFGTTPQEVSQDFYTWFTANATKQEVSLISFTIDGTSYQAEEGMTWEDWCESEYNTEGFYIGDYDNVVAPWIGSVSYPPIGDGTPVEKTEQIVADTAYWVNHTGGTN